MTPAPAPSGDTLGMPLGAVVELSAEGADAALGALGEVLHACVHAGASVGFVLPFPPEEARAYWRDAVLPAVAAGRRRLFAATVDGRLVGTAQLVLDTMPNQRHRADVAKVLVHPAARRAGVARALMRAVEAAALGAGRTLLTLDTRRGDAAEPLYLGLGYAVAGVIPRYCRAPDSERLDDTTVMYKHLA